VAAGNVPAVREEALELRVLDRLDPPVLACTRTADSAAGDARRVHDGLLERDVVNLARAVDLGDRRHSVDAGSAAQLLATRAAVGRCLVPQARDDPILGRGHQGPAVACVAETEAVAAVPRRELHGLALVVDRPVHPPAVFVLVVGHLIVRPAS
jgi:hypothetical protein